MKKIFVLLFAILFLTSFVVAERPSIIISIQNASMLNNNYNWINLTNINYNYNQSNWNISGTNLFPKSLDYNVGIGITTPARALEVIGETWVSDSGGGYGGIARVKINTFQDSIYGSDLTFVKSRNSSYGVYQKTLHNDRIGSIDWYGMNASHERTFAGTLRIEQDGDATSYLPSRFVFYTSNGTITPQEVMRIDKKGQVGIGTATPSYKFEVIDTTTQSVNLANTLFVDGQNQKVGIATTSPVGALDVWSNGAVAQAFFRTFTSSIYGSEFAFFKSGCDTEGLYCTTTNSMRLGTFDFYGVDVTNNSEWAAGFRVDQEGASGTRVPVKMSIYTGDGVNVPAERLKINSSGVEVLGNLTVKGTIKEQGASRVKANRGTAQTIATATKTVVEYNVEEWDNLGEYNSSYQFTATDSGYYYVNARVMFDSYAWTGGNLIVLYLYKNGVLLVNLERDTIEADRTMYKAVKGSTIISLEAGDYFDIRVYQSRGANSNLQNDPLHNYLEIKRES